MKPNVAEDPFEGVDLRFNLRYWPDTDFSIRSVDLGEISSGGPPPDGIPAIDNPVFENVADADTWLGFDWPVMLSIEILSIFIRYLIKNAGILNIVFPACFFTSSVKT